jgi:uncharacterized protein (TIGR03437 family)
MSTRTVLAFPALLLIIAFLLSLNASNREAAALAQSSDVPPIPVTRADRFGVYNWNVNDSAFPGDGSTDRLNWGANKVAEVGSYTIRIAISARDDYRVNPPGAPDLAQIAQSPAYDKLFRDPRFRTFLLTAYPRGALANNWSDGFTQAEFNAERDEIRRLCEYLLGQLAFTNKTFIILNWEGDNAIFFHSSKRSAWDHYTNWIRARAEGVKQAKQNLPGSGVRVYSGLEFSVVKSPKTNQPCGEPVADPVRSDPLQNRCLIDYVAPQVEVDYYSYSSWQSLVDKEVDANASLKQIYKRDLDFALAKIKARRPEISEKNFIVGELGFERSRYGECYAANYINQMFDAFDGPDAFRAAYIIFWQVLDNAKIYGLLDERFGLFRVRDGAMVPSLLGEAFQKRMNGQPVAEYTGCPRIRRWPEPPGVLNQQGTTDFSLNPDSVVSIYTPNCCQSTSSPFSPYGNTVHFDQFLERFQLPRDNDTYWYESRTQINFSIPRGRRPGEAWVYVTDSRGIDSNSQTIELACDTCPQINKDCGVLDTTYQTTRIQPGYVISIYGARFSPSGNTVVVEQIESSQSLRRRALPRESILFESATQINAKLPDDLATDLYTAIHVVSAGGLASNDVDLPLSPPCQECAPRLKPCQGIVNEAGGQFLAGTVATAIGRFSDAGNKVFVEQVDQQNGIHQYTITQGTSGWSENDKRIRFALPSTLFAGRAVIHVIDAQGLESRAQQITVSSTSVANVSAAKYRGPSLATESIVTAFGTALATTIRSASSTPLPTEIAGTRVIVKDSAGVERNAPLFFVSPTQINYLLPAGTANGPATATFISGFGSSSSGSAQIVKVEPGLFTANASGSGVPAAVVLRVKSDGAQIYEPASAFNQTTMQYVPLPIDLGPQSDQVFLILFGTGIRGLSSLTALTANIGGVRAEATFAGPHPALVGLDQINLRLPRSLVGRGETDVAINIDGIAANVVRISIK